MSTLTRNTMAKGIKLLRQYVYTPLSQVASMLSAPSVEAENLQQQRGTFRVALSWPAIDFRMFRETFATTNASFFSTLGVPFILPPLQEFWSDDGKTDPTTPQVTLHEITVSFDQRAEAAGVRADLGANYGQVDANIIGEYAIELRILEKLPEFFGGVAGGTAEREVYSATIPSAAFSPRTGRLNPFVIENLRVDVNPYRVYLVQLLCKSMDSTDNAMLPALTAVLKFSHPLVQRDTNDPGPVNVQNMPAHAGAKVPPVVTISTPAAGALISADAASGVHAQFNVIDAVLRAKLEGGYTKDSDRPATETVLDDSCYDVIAVPCFSWVGTEGAMTAAHADEIPYGGAAPYEGPAVYRHIIPLQWPFVVHHVVAFCNYGKPAIAGGTGIAQLPLSASLEYEVGVMLGTGLRGDTTTYQQVAHLGFKPGDGVAIIDNIKGSIKPILNASLVDYELRAIPLVQPGAANGQGFQPQGSPFFCGWATSNTQPRSNCGDIGGASVAPVTAGREQWLEVRFSIGDTVGLDTIPNGGAAASADDTYTGMGGHWVFIIGKKTAAVAQGEIRQ